MTSDISVGFSRGYAGGTKDTDQGSGHALCRLFLAQQELGCCSFLAASLASFQGEGVLLRLLDRRVQVKVRQQLAAAWALEILWRRAGEAGGACQEGLLERLLSLPVEQLIQKCWVWYEPLMFGRVDGMRGCSLSSSAFR